MRPSWPLSRYPNTEIGPPADIGRFILIERHFLTTTYAT